MTKILEYSKQILQKVSFDTMLLRKEYTKAVKMLTRTERLALNSWMKEHRLLPVRVR
ncbi:hypothetical protein OAH12_02200 [Cyclobacteriaceae bacterium]|nr:hypothetical protein [Cyclobacteriaceae bacterium]